MPLPDNVWTMFDLLAQASERYRKATGWRVVIVGGAAASFYSQGAILSGDFDIVADIGFEETLLGEGFVRDTGPGTFLGGFYHPSLPELGVELVSGALFDGKADEEKIVAVRFSGDAQVLLPSVEDMIADRLGQYAASFSRDRRVLEQATILMELALDPDVAYLRRRIADEGGDPTLIGLS